MSLARQNKGPRKDGPHGQASPTQPRRGGGPGGGGGVWRGAQNNPSIMQNYSPRTPPAMMAQVPLPSTNSTSSQPNNFPNDSNYAGNPNVSLPPAPSLPPINLNGSLIVVTTHGGVRHEGTLVNNDQAHPGISLKDAKDLVNLGMPLIPSYFIPAQQIANWKRPELNSAPAVNGNKALDTFRTDREISSGPSGPRERELQAWKSDGPTGPAFNEQGRDAMTFGNQANGRWDQFAVNEKLFGLSTDYNEEMYTTKLDRTTPDYREKERKAQQVAKEIEGGASTNPHIREERGLTDEVGNEEDKYGAVMRGPNAYVPPGARRGDGSGPPSANLDGSKPSTPTVASPTPPIPKLSVNGPDEVVSGDQVNGTPKVNGNGEQKSEDLAVVQSFRSFVSSERQRIVQKRHAITKHDMDKRLADLINFGSSFKLNKPMPADLVPILAKDETKQKAILEKSARDAGDRKARNIGMSIPPAAGPLPVPGVAPVAPGPAPVAAKPSANRSSGIQAIPPFKGGKSSGDALTPEVTGTGQAVGVGKVTPPAGKALPKRAPIAMSIAKIPPFDPSKRRPDSSAQTSANGTTTTTPASPTSVSSRLNVNASSFRPNPSAPAFKPGGPSPTPSTSPTSKPAETVTPNPYFGVRQIKKGVAVHIKDDFNPFKYNKVSDAGTVPSVWPFTGRRYQAMLPPVPHPPALVPHPPAPPSYEEDSAAQAAQAARMSGYPMMFYPYQGYPGPQPPQQHMMGGPNQGPPAGYLGNPYIQPMQYPQGVPQNGNPMYAPPPMPGMPPQQGYMPPPPPQGGYQPNGGPRGSMPPTPMPQHAYAAYHQSPQMAHQHALQYPMMMPPQGPGVPPHGYDQQQQGPGPMGVGH